jgi:hypothetical protein
MVGMIYSLCALTALLCAWQLLRAWRRSRYRLLWWSGLCFVGLAVSNLLLVADKLLPPQVDLSAWRYLITLVSMLVLVFGLIWETD